MALRLSVIIPFIVLLAACGSKDNVEPPADLKDIQADIQAKQVWEEDTGSGTGKHFLRLQPFLFNQVIFVADAKGQISAFNSDTGRQLWSQNTGLLFSGGVNGGADLIVAGSVEGELAGFSPEKGQELWRAKLSSEVHAVSRSVSGKLVARTNDGTLYGINALDGSVAWKHNYKVPALSLRSASVPLIVQGRVIAGLDNGHLVALSLADGKLLWEKTIASGRGRTELDRMVDIDGSLAEQNGIIYVASFQGRIAAVNMANGRLVWAHDASSVNGLTVDSKAVYYTDSDSKVWALDKNTGASLWKQDALLHRSVSAPAVLDDQVVVADYDGYLHWLSADDGRFTGRNRISGSAVLAAPTIYQNRLYVLNKSGDLSAWQIRPSK